MPEPIREAPGLSDSDRLETFCDGVFAIAITLLILEIQVPTPERVHAVGGLLPALAALWPSYLGYLIGFLTIGIMWTNHHAIFQYVRRSDRYFLMINVVFLMLIAFLPFPTALLAAYLAEADDRATAIVVYGATVWCIALAYNAVWWYAVRRGLLDPAADQEAVRTISTRYKLGPLAYAGVILLVFLSPWASLVGHFALAAFYLLPERAPAAPARLT
jgi:uncharacterized membrane protein